ncbi:unnamed protein product [Moneuplotes crassus]|uniref:Uncharacterized protein n=1 Tax=Euplotes crassus TaxID=5936 RepID=A0AAD1YAV4_EUPCR|nr:unnamed protein product [Moneuplotes crassus]
MKISSRRNSSGAKRCLNMSAASAPSRSPDNRFQQVKSKIKDIYLKKFTGNFPEFHDYGGHYRSISIRRDQISSILKEKSQNRADFTVKKSKDYESLIMSEKAPLNISKKSGSNKNYKEVVQSRRSSQTDTHKRISSNPIQVQNKRRKRKSIINSAKKESIFGRKELQIGSLFNLDKSSPEDPKPKRKLKNYEQIRHNIAQSNKVRANFMKALKMNEDDYLKEFKDKAASITQRLNQANDGEGSSALFNLNMHQDYIINKLGLKKKLTGHDLVIKILLFKIFGLNKQQQEDAKESYHPEPKPKSAASVRFDRKRINMSANRGYLKDHLRNFSKEKRKPGTQQGIRYSNNLASSTAINNSRASERNKKHTNSLDVDSALKVNTDLFSMNNTSKDQLEKLSPRSTLNNIIDQCYQISEDNLLSLGQEVTNADSMFDLSQTLAERQKKVFKSGQESSLIKAPIREKSNVQSKDGSRKRVTFQIDKDEEEGSPIKNIADVSILSMSESIDSEESGHLKLPSKYESSQTREMRFRKMSNRLNNFYKPALMTKNFQRQMPLFLSEKNMTLLSHLFKTTKHENKYVDSITKTKGFMQKKMINKQKTKTQDQLGELSTQDDIKNFLDKEPSEIFANALENFWFKDADKFLRMKKSKHSRKKSLLNFNEEDVYQRMSKDIHRRNQRDSSGDKQIQIGTLKSRGTCKKKYILRNNLSILVCYLSLPTFYLLSETSCSMKFSLKCKI